MHRYNRKGIIAENCPPHQAIVQEGRCKDAADSLKLSFTSTINNTSYPAGCMYKRIDMSGYDPVHFNKVIDLSKANPEESIDSGGICSNDLGDNQNCYNLRNMLDQDQILKGNIFR